jgi:hypothetical protein
LTKNKSKQANSDLFWKPQSVTSLQVNFFHPPDALGASILVVGVPRKGPVERVLSSELNDLESSSPLSGTLSMLALKLARAVDAVPDDQLTEIMRAMTQLRLILDQIVRRSPGAPVGPVAPEELVGGVVGGDDFSDLIGPVRAEVVDPSTL